MLPSEAQQLGNYKSELNPMNVNSPQQFVEHQTTINEDRVNELSCSDVRISSTTSPRLCFRIGHHSTSDDSLAYRSKDEIESWKQYDSPINKLRMYMEASGLWDEAKEKAWIGDARDQILAAFNEAEKRPKPNWQEMFHDVYKEVPAHIE